MYICIIVTHGGRRLVYLKGIVILVVSLARDKDSKSRVRALSRGDDTFDKSHLSERRGKDEGSTTKSDFQEQDKTVYCPYRRKRLNLPLSAASRAT